MQANIRWSEFFVGFEVACISGSLFVPRQTVYETYSAGVRPVHLCHSNRLVSAKTVETKLHSRRHDLTAETARLAVSAQTEKCKHQRPSMHLNTLPVLASESRVRLDVVKVCRTSSTMSTMSLLCTDWRAWPQPQSQAVP